MSMTTALRFVWVIVFFIPLLTFGQAGKKKQVNTIGLFELVVGSPGQIVIENAEVHFNTNLLEEHLLRNHITVSRDSLSRIVLPHHITFRNCIINFYAQNMAMPGIWMVDSEIKDLWLENIVPSNRIANADGSINTVYIKISECQVSNIRVKESHLSFDSQVSTYANPIQFTNSDFTDLVSWRDKVEELILDSNRINNLTLISEIQIFNCVNNRLTRLFLSTGGKLGWIEITKNKVDDLVIEDIEIVESLLINDNILANVYIEALREDFYLDIDWDQLKGHKIRYPYGMEKWSSFKDDTGFGFIDPQDSAVVLNKERYYPIIELYSKLISRYKILGRLEDSNSAFIELKDIEGARYLAKYESTRESKYYFRWLINILMKWYTEHGTDPGKSIMISFWVIFFFGIFYVFFPSDWDPVSKIKLIENFKDFINKNDKGYVKPALLLLLGLLISLINAFTLSLNSFTTLGFGNIPTHGLARYFCVLEGFIGWFLLSIFTVALFNQVLF